MAIDVYLQIDGVKGESAEETHKGWIECLSVDWAVTQPKSATSSTAGGHTAERANLSEIGLTKLADLASPILFQLSACGKTLPKAKLEFMRADGDGKPIKYFEIQLENVLISDMASSVSEGVVLSESRGLKFSKIKLAYIQQKLGGGTLGSTTGGWDLALNRIAA